MQLGSALLLLLLSSSCSTGYRVAVVTGATRGIGRGIALALGQKGYKVYALGRSTRSQQTTERAVAAGLDLTVDSAADAINAAGGTGVGLACDCGDDEDIRRALGEVAEAERGRLDLLVCSAYTTPPGVLRGSFWTQGVGMWDACNGVGLRGVFSTCCAAVPMLIEGSRRGGGDGRQPPPLIVLVSSFGGQSYTFNVAYGVGKAAVDRLAQDMAYQLKKHSIAAVSLYPGIVQTEGNLEMLEQGTWDAASGGLDLTSGETPEFSGRAVCALAELSADELLSKYSVRRQHSARALHAAQSDRGERAAPAARTA